METIDISGALGITATILLTLNFLLGMMLSVSYKKFACWQALPPVAKKIDVNALHNYTAYIAWAFILAHIILIPLDPASKFNWTDLVWPLHAPHQPWSVLAGSASLYALVLVIVTTQKVVKRKLGYRAWKNIHLVSYGTAVLFVVHGVTMDPLLKDRTVDWFDAEKLVSELCGLALVAVSVVRYRYHVLQGRVKNLFLSKNQSL